MQSPIWFITGAFRGFGLEIDRAAIERGDAVVAVARDPKVVERALSQHEQLLAVERTCRLADAGGVNRL